MSDHSERIGYRGLVGQRPIGHDRGPLALEERALRAGWHISEEKREEIIESALALATNVKKSDKVRLQAMRVLLLADSLNIRREKNEQEEGIAHKQLQADKLRSLLASPDGQKLLSEVTRLTVGKSDSSPDCTVVDKPTDQTPPPPALLGEDKGGEEG